MGSTERFGYEWKKYNQIIPEYEIQFLKWVYPLQKQDFFNKKILDAGCGMGRNSYWPLTYEAKELIAIDFDQRTVNEATKNLSSFSNAIVKHLSIYDLDYNEEFDIAFSIGVIHHLENPDLAINNLIKSVNKNGFVLMWVYGYEGNEWIVKYINPIRAITSKIPLPITHLFAYFLSSPLYFYLKIIPQRRPYLKQLSKFKFWHVHSIVFDQLIPKIANYWKKEEVLSLFENKGVHNIQIFPVNNNSWTILGQKD